MVTSVVIHGVEDVESSTLGQDLLEEKMAKNMENFLNAGEINSLLGSVEVVPQSVMSLRLQGQRANNVPI
jgi:hypothetical protein